MGAVRSEVLLLAAGGVAAALWYVGKNPASVGQQLGGAAVDLVSGVVTGGVLSAGDAIGIPRTNVSQGEAELAAGDYWNASFHLPAGQFISGVWNRLTN
jgi:hypothetical protein